MILLKKIIIINSTSIGRSIHKRTLFTIWRFYNGIGNISITWQQFVLFLITWPQYVVYSISHDHNGLFISYHITTNVVNFLSHDNKRLFFSYHMTTMSCSFLIKWPQELVHFLSHDRKSLFISYHMAT